MKLSLYNITIILLVIKKIRQITEKKALLLDIKKYNKYELQNDN